MMKNLMTATALTLTLGLGTAMAQGTAPTTPPAGGDTQMQSPAPGGESSGSPSAPGGTTPPAGGAATDSTTPPAGGAASDSTTPPSGGTAGDSTTPPSGDTATDSEAESDTESADAGEASGEVEFLSAQEDGQWLAEDYIGTAVNNASDENLGNISDILVDENGQVIGAVVGVGGFLGIGQKSVAVNFDAIEETVNQDGSVELTLQADRETLENAPEFETLADKESATASGGAGGGMTTGSTPPAGGGMGGGMGGGATPPAGGGAQ